MRKKLITLISTPLLLLFSAVVFAGDITSTGMSQADLYKLLVNMTTAQKNKSMTAAGFTVSALNPVKVKTANTLQFAVGGYNHSKAATDSITGSGAVQALSTYCMYLLSIDQSGAFVITKGTAVATDTAVLPALPSNAAPVGSFKVWTSAATFTLGTTSLTAPGLTVTYTDIGTMMTGSSKVSLTGL